MFCLDNHLFRLDIMSMFSRPTAPFLLKLLILWTSTLCVSNAISISEGPSDARVTIGSSVVFKCLVNDVGLNREYIRWIKHGPPSEYLSQNDRLLPNLSTEKKERFSIKHIYSIQFDLEISRVLYSDMGTYECVYMRYNGQRWIEQSFSPEAIAQLTVLKEPSRDSPRCTIVDEGDNVLHTTSLQGNDLVKFQCSSHSHGSTSPNLTLTFSGLSEQNSVAVNVDEYDLKVVSSEIVSPVQGMSVHCVLESEALFETKICQLIPNVQPVVNIEPNNISLHVGHNVKLDCITSGFPNDYTLEYKWDIFPELPNNEFVQENSSSMYLSTTNISFNSSSYLIICKVFSLNDTYSASSVLQVKTASQTSSSNFTTNSKTSLASLSLFPLIIVIIILFFIWRRHKKRKLSRFTGLRYTIEPSTNSNTNVPIHSETRSSNIYSAGTDTEKPVSRSSSVKENLYAKYRKFRKSQEISVLTATNTTSDDKVNDTVRAIIENHRLSDIEPLQSKTNDNLTIADENPENHDTDVLHSSVVEDHSNEECSAHIYENIVIKSADES